MIFIDHFIKPNTDTIFQIDTTILGSSDSNSIRIEANNNFYGEVFWGDGSSNVYTSAISISLTHTYAVAGIYTITIRMNFGYYYKQYINNALDRNKFIKFIRFGDGLILGSGAFYGATNFNCDATIGKIKHVDAILNNAFRGYPFAKVNNIESLDVSNVTSMISMFQSSLFNQDISMWNFNKNVVLQSFMNAKTSANYNASFYDALLQKWADVFIGTGRTQTNKAIGMGSIKYTAVGKPYRDALVADGFTFTDGGMI